MSDLTVGHNTVVAISYTLKNSEGHVLDTASLGQPLIYLHGSGAIIPGLEEALTGCAAGDTLHIIVPPEQAYGPHIPGMTREVSRAIFPSALRLHRGMPFSLEFDDATLSSRIWFVSEVHRDIVVLDSNHPLAGETLFMDVRVVSIRPASEEDRRHLTAEDQAPLERWGL